VLSVTARDAMGNTSKDTLTITYTVPDVTAPAISITAPTSNATYSTTAANINLAGTASDNVSVKQVTWSNNRGGNGAATGTTSWSVANVVLQSGQNIITTTAHDAAGNTSNAVLTVTYTPNRPPVITSAAAIPDVSALPGDSIVFSVAASDPDGNILSYTWNFGDGASASGANVSHTYTAPGNYTATVNVSDGLGGSVNTTILVTINVPISVKVNFQLAGGLIPAGYLEDTGALFGDRGNGFTYGWNVDNSINARDRNAANSPDQRYDTFIHMQKPNAPSAAWEIALPNGTYSVRAVCGDPSYFDSVYKLDIEGILTVDGVPNATTKWFEGTQVVAVTDGRLTVSSAANASNNKLNFIEIASASPVAREIASGAPSADPLIVLKLQIKSNFARERMDSFQVTGLIPSLSSETITKGSHVSIDVGAAIVDFVLDAKGHGKNKSGTLKLMKNRKKWMEFPGIGKEWHVVSGLGRRGARRYDNKIRGLRISGDTYD